MKTVLLAGGFGTRLSEETVIKPKPMVEIGEMPILWHIMKTYAHFGHNEFLVALGYKGHFIKQYFNNFLTQNRDVSINLRTGEAIHKEAPQEAEDWLVHLCDTGSKTLTGGRLHRLKEQLNGEQTFMLTYGDGVANINIEALLAFHKSHGKLATVTAVRPPARFGAMIMDGDEVSEFKEKPQIGEGWINGGFFVFEKEIFNYLDGDQTILERAPLENLTRDKQLMAFKHEGFWQPMDTVRDRDSLNDLWKTDTPPWKVW